MKLKVFRQIQGQLDEFEQMKVGRHSDNGGVDWQTKVEEHLIRR